MYIFGPCTHDMVHLRLHTLDGSLHCLESLYIVHQGHGAPRVRWNHFDCNLKACEKGDAREQKSVLNET